MGETKEIRQDEGIDLLRSATGESTNSTDGKESKAKEPAKKPKREEIVE